MTDEQILQALRLCGKIDSNCRECKLWGDDRYVEHLAGTAADLIERLSGEIEALRKKLAMSDEDVTVAHLHFSQWQAAFHQLTQTVSRIEDEAEVGKFCAAIRAQLAAWGKAMEGTA